MNHEIPSSTSPLAEPGYRVLRVWPALLIVVAVVAMMVVPANVIPRTVVHFMTLAFGPTAGMIALSIWWTTLSRARRTERWLPVVAVTIPAAVLMFTIFPIEGNKAMAVIIYGLPVVLLLWVGWAVLARRLLSPRRLIGTVMLILLGWLGVAQVRVDQTDAELRPEWRFWWQPTEEKKAELERAARQTNTAPPTGEVTPVKVSNDDWPEFRGSNRDGRVTGVSINPDWDTNPPTLLWKQRIGPGWGSFSVVGSKLFTQEQRGETEAIVCYDGDTGREVWATTTPVRFEETIAGPGPRATPTINDGKLYAMGATGILSCLDAATGKTIWTTDITKSTGGSPPQWGYASSPLIVDGLAIVYTGGPKKGLAAFRIADGSPAWAAGEAMHSYSSAQLATIHGTPQVLYVSDFGLESFQPDTGEILWKSEWKVNGVNRVTQPAVDGYDVIFGTGVDDRSSRRIHVERNGETWSTSQVWSSKAIAPYFNDSVSYQGHLYGFDDKSFVCVRQSDGKQLWKTGTQYGHGQVTLLADQGLLVVQQVNGKVTLVEANTEEHVERGSFKGLSGKTWNHPVVAHGRLYLRNGQEMACYTLSPK